MLFRMKDEKAHQLEAELDKLQADASASASPLARMPSASWARANFSASACTLSLIHI